MDSKGEDAPYRDTKTQIQQYPSQLPAQQPRQNPNHVNAPPPPAHGPQFQPYMPPAHPYTYPMPGYYGLQPGQHVDLSPQHATAQSMYEIPRPTNGSAMVNQANYNNMHPMNHRNGIMSPPNNERATARNGSSNDIGKARGALPMTQARSAWSYGPGIGIGGYVAPARSVGGDVVGPRLSSTRRQSNNSVGSSGNSRSSNCDDVSSTAVSYARNALSPFLLTRVLTTSF